MRAFGILIVLDFLQKTKIEFTVFAVYIRSQRVQVDRREWATLAYNALLQGDSITLCPRGDSMKGRIDDGNTVTIEPCIAKQVAVGDVVLARVRDKIIVLHEVLEENNGEFLIGTTAGRADGWVAASDIFGRVTAVSSEGQ